MMRMLITTSSVFALVGCSIVGPNYEPPSMELASQFVDGGSSSILDAIEDPWWTRLNDPLLNALIARGAAQSLDLLGAVERIETANAALGQTGLNAQTDGSLASSAQRQGTDGTATTTSVLQVNAGYVFDLFGGVARGQERSLADYEAAQLDVGTVRLAYLSELTNSYLQARYYQEAAAITRQSIASRRQTLAIVNDRRALGDATELEVQQARSLLASAQAPLPVMVANFEINVFRIATLLAEPAGPLMEELQSGAPQPRPSGFTSTGLPADLLRNRPDVRFAERRFAAATAAVGVAEAQLYPSLELTGSLGTGTTDRWAFGPFVSIPVLSRGLLRSRQAVAESNARGAELSWRQSVLSAVEDVQVAMTLCRNWHRQIQHLERASNASRNVLRLSRESYALGEVTLTEVLDAERINASNRLSLADATRNYAVSWMQVQVATGRGWRVEGLTGSGEVAAPELVEDPLGLEGTQFAFAPG